MKSMAVFSEMSLGTVFNRMTIVKNIFICVRSGSEKSTLPASPARNLTGYPLDAS